MKKHKSMLDTSINGEGLLCTRSRCSIPPNKVGIRRRRLLFCISLGLGLRLQRIPLLLIVRGLLLLLIRGMLLLLERSLLLLLIRSLFVARTQRVAAPRTRLVPAPAPQPRNSEKARPRSCQRRTPCLGLADSTPAGNDTGIGWVVGQQGTGCCRFVEQGVGGRKTAE